MTTPSPPRPSPSKTPRGAAAAAAGRSWTAAEVRPMRWEDPTIRTQFLSSAATAGTTNYEARLSLAGSILDIAHRITESSSPSEDCVDSGCVDSGCVDSGCVDSGCVDSGCVDSGCVDPPLMTTSPPTLAPPMEFTEIPTDPTDMYSSFVPTILKKKRKSSHSGRGGTSKNRRHRWSDDSRKSSDSDTATTTTATTTPLEYPPEVRVLPNPMVQPKTHVIYGDEAPQRMVNPLLTLPHYPTHIESPPLDEIPTAAELWKIAELHSADPDTWPISYLAHLLGFRLPESGVHVPFAGPFDVDALNLQEDPLPIKELPPLGTFVTQIWKQETEEDSLLTVMDPLWKTIRHTYKGGEDFKNATKGYVTPLSPCVLEFAMERGVIGNEEVSFRMAVAEDVPVLSAWEEKCPTQSKPDLATYLQTPGNFCILAESANHIPLAFVQYKFCWYKVEEKKSGSNHMTSYGVKSRAGEAVDQVSELVFFIDNVIYRDVAHTIDMKQPDSETVRVLLLSLALIHAWNHNIWYGMMETHHSLVPFYEKYFRMTTIERDNNDESNHSLTPLVCDLKKCSFQYAIHLLEERLNSIEPTNSSLVAAPTIHQRMLVQLPTPSGSLGHCTSFSNANQTDHPKKQVHIRISNAPQTDTLSDIFSVSAVDGQEETVTKMDVSSLDEVPTEWNAFKLFSTSLETTSSNSDDSFLAEMKKKQDELKRLESSIEITSRSLLKKAYDDALDFQLGGRKAEKERQKQVLKDFEEVKQRLHEADMAWQAQLEQDMDAVCDICWDGEVTPENQIIFCDSCNVAVHQGCYGIDKVPSGNYFCHPCIHHGKNNEFLAAERREGPRTAPTRTPIVCELCPRRQGAFVQTETTNDSLRKPRWVHVGCAKWSGVNYVDIEKRDMIEDLSMLKEDYRGINVTCALCKSGIGAMHKCREAKCNKWLHLTCARCVGTCSVQHGENCEGLYAEADIPHPPWTLACIDHSVVDPESIRKNSITVEQLKAIAESYPPEPVPPKPFNKLNAKERREYWADSDNLEAFFKKVRSIKSGAICSICMASDCDEYCETCSIYFHAACVGTNGCLRCKYNTEEVGSDDYKEPKCQMCKSTNGPIVRTFAKPVSMKKWKSSKSGMVAYKKSLFGPNNFCHVLCGFWNPGCEMLQEGNSMTVSTSNITMTHGQGFILDKRFCLLCGSNQGAKVQCNTEGCKQELMHVTCARAAGFEVTHGDDIGFFLRCYRHSESPNNLRARLEDMLEVEICRSKNKVFDKGFLPMTWEHASSLYHSAVNVLRVIGWAWRWADWWVAEGDNWEPLLEDWQNEEDMTPEELKIVESTPESRCKDARKCRLAAFGAALRNREYDKEDDDQPLERALRAILCVPSLVGPLKKKEIDFFVQWLSLAYQSKSPLLGFGDDKIPVTERDDLLHIVDNSPKYELGNRSLPGKAEPEHAKTSFEPLVEEVDDFLRICEKVKLNEKQPLKEEEQSN